MPRFSLKTLLIAVAGVFAVVGFLTAPFSAAFVATETVILWVGAVTICMESDHPLQTSACGYAFGSLVYASLAFWVGPAVLFREEILNVIEPLIQASLMLNPEFSRDSALPAFLWVTHSYLCVAVGVTGGWAAAWLYRRSCPSTRFDASRRQLFFAPLQQGD
jgi:hypothetical protein